MTNRRWAGSLFSGFALLALITSNANLAEAVSLNEACTQKAMSLCAPLAASCGTLNKCLGRPAALARTTCSKHYTSDLGALRQCAPCRDAVTEVSKDFAACTILAPKPKPSGSAVASAPPAPSSTPMMGSPNVVPELPADCKANLPQADVNGLVSDSGWGYCDANKADCPCSYKPCTIGTNYTAAAVLEPSFVDPASPGWSKTKVQNGTGASEWMYCTVRSCKLSATNTNTDQTWLRCWSKPLTP